MSNFFEDLTNLVTDNTVTRVLVWTLLILLLSAAVAAGLVVLLLKFIFRHTA
jgi:hypothetical protein